MLTSSTVFACLAAVMLCAALATAIAIPAAISRSKERFDGKVAEISARDQAWKLRLETCAVSDTGNDLLEVPLELAPQRFSVLE